MFWLRFFAGFGIGGVIPNIVAINAESAPRHLRATLAIIAVGFVPVGGALAGFASAALDSALRLADPVSDRRCRSGDFRARRDLRAAGVDQISWRCTKASGQRWKLVAAIRPDFDVPPNARFVIEDEQQAPTSNPVYLFRNGWWLITPLHLASLRAQPDGLFLPHQLDADVAARRQAAAGDGGARRRRAAGRRHQSARWCCAGGCSGTASSPLRSCLCSRCRWSRSIGYAGLTSTTALYWRRRSSPASWCSASSPASTSSGALIYPTSLRANGSGWQLGIGRSALIVGPLLGALFVGLSVAEALHLVGAAVRRRRGGVLRHLRCSTTRGCARIRNWRRRSRQESRIAGNPGGVARGMCAQ